MFGNFITLHYITLHYITLPFLFLLLRVAIVGDRVPTLYNPPICEASCPSRQLQKVLSLSVMLHPFLYLCCMCSQQSTCSLVHVGFEVCHTFLDREAISEKHFLDLRIAHSR